AVALVVLDQALGHGLVGSNLPLAGGGGVDAKAFCIGIAAEAANHFGASHLGNIGRLELRRSTVIGRIHFLGQGLLVAGFINAAEPVHAAQNPVASFLGARWIGQRVE